MAARLPWRTLRQVASIHGPGRKKKGSGGGFPRRRAMRLRSAVPGRHRRARHSPSSLDRWRKMARSPRRRLTWAHRDTRPARRLNQIIRRTCRAAMNAGRLDGGGQRSVRQPIRGIDWRVLESHRPFRGEADHPAQRVRIAGRGGPRSGGGRTLRSTRARGAPSPVWPSAASLGSALRQHPDPAGNPGGKRQLHRAPGRDPGWSGTHREELVRGRAYLGFTSLPS